MAPAARWRELVAEYGSPLYVYDLARVREAHSALLAALPASGDLHYSLKANPHPGVVGELGRLGCLAEVSSAGELDAALAGAVAPERCLYTGPGKSRGEVEHALRLGVRRFSVESGRDLARVAASACAGGRVAEVLLRLNPSGPPPGAGLAMTGTESQFGTDVERLLDEGPAWLRTPGATPVGFHVYMGTNIADPAALLSAFATALDAAAQVAAGLGVEPAAVNLGGGFGHPFARRGARPDLSSLRPALERLLDRRLPGWRRREPAVAFESGRYLVAAAGTLLCTVEDVKVSRGARYVVADSGINHLGGMATLGRVVRAEPDVEVISPTAGDPPAPARVVGPLCTPADLRASRAPLPALRPGAVLAIPNVGAYGLTSGLVAFLSRPCPVEVVVDGDRVVEASQLVLRREPR